MTTDFKIIFLILREDIKNDISLTQKWDKFEALISNMVHINPRLRPDCSQILSGGEWSISNNEIELFNFEVDGNDYPDHFFKTYIKKRILVLKSKN